MKLSTNFFYLFINLTNINRLNILLNSGNNKYKTEVITPNTIKPINPKEVQSLIMGNM
ncbi:hypothetical protein CCAND93_670008 [Capnocytophaga canis]|uniref:Uncharacterized protein n=1 Tax=Capnocytophaga canis TaxID=1848903 RepID=A0A0B7IQ54_9FLAO|nr:hypothetical protein CCAND93_670008 [Capnocytophaga canis]